MPQGYGFMHGLTVDVQFTWDSWGNHECVVRNVLQFFFQLGGLLFVATRLHKMHLVSFRVRVLGSARVLVDSRDHGDITLLKVVRASPVGPTHLTYGLSEAMRRTKRISLASLVL